jgi:tripartite-type tricarboxylate transporter receptor subunit TctC
MRTIKIRPPGIEQRRAALRFLVAPAVASVAAGLAPTPTHAQAWPSKPIRLVVPIGAGGLGDLVARQVAEHAGKRLGQPIVVENRPGAGGTIGSNVVATAAADGYTLLLGSIGTLAIAPSLYKKMPYDSDRAFAPVSLVAGGQFFLVANPSLPVGSAKELIDYAKARPGKLNYGSVGNGTALHLGMELMKKLAGIDIVHVPYKSAPEMATALVAGDIQLGLSDVPSALPYLRNGRMKALAATSRKRSALAPEVPTLVESGLTGFELVSWVGILAPAGTPADIVSRINDAIVKGLAEPAAQETLARIGASEVFASSPEAFASFLKAEREKWAPLVEASGAVVN